MVFFNPFIQTTYVTSASFTNITNATSSEPLASSHTFLNIILVCSLPVLSKGVSELNPPHKCGWRMNLSVSFKISDH